VHGFGKVGGVPATVLVEPDAHDASRCASSRQSRHNAGRFRGN
jgi:hypothetical protein